MAAPVSRWMMQDIDGVQYSGVMVVSISRPISSGSMPAASMARLAACAPIYQVGSPSEMWRVPIPVLVLIHSSLVSTIFAISSLVT